MISFMNPDFLVFLLYLFYGMAFFAIGVSITSRDMRASHLKIAGTLWLLALFAYSHAFHEWFELYQNLPSEELGFATHNTEQVYIAKLLLVLISYLFLLSFGIRVLELAFPQHRQKINLLPIPFALFLLIVVSPFFIEFSTADYSYIDARIRNFIGLPGAIISGIGLLFYSRSLKDISEKGAWNFSGAGYALMVYGILTGIIPSGFQLPIVALPIELFRGLAAFIILHFVMHALFIFDEERRLMIEDHLGRFAKAEKLHALGKLAFGIAHEINNPLSNVSMTVEMLKDDLSSKVDSDKTGQRFATIERNLDRASKIARELLNFSADREETLFEATAINEVIESTLELVGAQRKRYRFAVDLAPVEEISAIPWKLEEVFLNLLINAMEATPEGEEIRIRSWQVGKEIRIEISDCGSGIRADHLDHVLEPFFTTKDVGQGTGLGLSICYGIIEQHGGHIELKSEVGQGTSVSLGFPSGVKSNV